MADALERNVRKPRATKGGLKLVNFVKESETGPRAGVEGNGLLGTATDRKMRVDLKQRMEFPSEIAVTNKMPILSSGRRKQSRQCYWELTVSWGERIKRCMRGRT